MRTNVAFDLTEAQRETLGLQITGRRQLATRKQITEWVTKLAADALEPAKPGATTLQNMVCPKCSKPIAVSVPKATTAAPVERPAQNEKMPKAAADTQKAIGALILSLHDLKNSLDA